MRKRLEIEKLRNTIQKELGIDITKYRDEEVAENLLDLMLFPKYILKWVSRPLLLCLMIYVIGFFLIDLVHIEYLIYAVVGLLLFVILGIFLGILYLARELGEDVESIAKHSLGIMKNSVLDIDNIGGRINKSNMKDVMGMLFKGIIIVVTIPMLKKAIDKKLPAGKGVVKKLMSGTLVALASRVSFDGDKIDDHLVVVDGEDKKVTKYASVVDRTESTLSTAIQGVARIGSTPFRLGAYISGFLLLIFLWIIW